ncbi:acyltransferase [Methanobrevibacter sp.]|uniref:acyltransferase n=1 Tax=Methanobrevibacter sp. TaxID=66852 RepID=UPI0039752DA4
MQRIKYYDTLRFLAIFAVIALHVFQSWPNAAVSGIKLEAFSEIFKFAVPVFLMISGALLLKRDMPVNEFLKKRFARLTYPFILYMIIYVAVLLLILMNVAGFGGLERWLHNVPLNYNWYFWTIASLYLAVPILSRFVNNSTFRELEYFIAVVLVGCIFYQATLLFHIKHFIDLNFFISPIAYLILGYYLANKDFKMSANRMVTLALAVFLFATLCKMSGHIFHIPMQVIQNYEATRSMILSSYIDMGFLQILQASAVFVMFRYVYEAKDGITSKVKGFLNGKIVNRFILSVSMASYGMYLFHHTIIEPMRVYFKHIALSGSQIAILIVVFTIAIFIISWIVVLIISRIPVIGRFSGYH